SACGEYNSTTCKRIPPNDASSVGGISMATAEVQTRRDGRGAAAPQGNGKQAPGRYRTSAGQPHPLGATPDQGGVNFSVFSEHATAIELLLFDAHDDQEP